MKKYSYRVLLLGLVLSALTGCKTLHTPLSIREQALPTLFTKSTDSTTIATLNWRDFFQDSLLTQLIDTALSNNQDLMMSYQRMEMARASVQRAEGFLRPAGTFGSLSGVRKFGLYTMDGAGNISTEMLPGKIVPVHLPDILLGVNASWELDIWHKLRNQRKSAIASYLSSAEGVNFMKAQLVSQVAASYYELQALDNEIEVVNETIQRQEEELLTVRYFKEAGRENLLAVQQFEAQLLSTKALVYVLRQNLLVEENRINLLLGRYPQPVRRSKLPATLATSPMFSTGVPSQLVQNRPDIRAAEFQVQASKFDVQVARAAFYPTVSLTASFGYQAFSPRLLFNTPASIMYTALGNLVGPLFNRNGIKAQFNLTKAQQIEAMYGLQKTLVQAYLEVVNSISEVENVAQVSNLKTQQSALLVQSTLTSRELFNTGRASYLEVLLAQQNALQAQLELAQVVRNQQLAKLYLYKALGGGWR